MKKKLSIFLEYLNAVIVGIGMLAALFVGLFIFAGVIFFFGDMEGDPGDIIRWGVYLANKAPVLGVGVMVAAIYAVIFLTKLEGGK